MQVVTAGADWPSTVAAISGGIVGLGGLAIAAWTTLKNIKADDDRTRKKEKREIYARHLAAMSDLVRAQVMLHSAQQAKVIGPPYWSAVMTYADTTTAVLTTAAVVQLVAPPDVGKLATESLPTMPTDQHPIQWSPDIYLRGLGRLLRAMRKDLGEHLAPEQPPQTGTPPTGDAFS